VETSNTIAAERPGTAVSSAGLCQMATVVLCLFCVRMAFAEDVPWQGRETWTDSGTRGWSVTTGDADVTNPGDHLDLRHREQPNAPAYGEDTARIAMPEGIVPTNVCFSFLSEDTPPSEMWICFEARSSNLWYKVLPRPPEGVTVDYDIPVDFAHGWIRGSDSRPTQFFADVRDVAWIGLYVRRNGKTSAQDYRIDDFTVSGTAHTSDVDGDGMDDAWENRHGLNAANASDGKVDRDGDGMSSYGEFRAGTDPNDSVSVFEVEIDATPSVVLRWNSISNRTYTVLRAGNVRGKPVPLAEGILATPPKNEYTVDGKGEAAGFYRIEVENE